MVIAFIIYFISSFRTYPHNKGRNNAFIYKLEKSNLDRILEIKGIISLLNILWIIYRLCIKDIIKIKGTFGTQCGTVRL
jgi:hypothetical protein